MKIALTDKQKRFSDALSDEVLFGGAAGGGKSYGQMIDALVFALRYKNSRQLILRRTLVELERTLIPTALSLYPAEVWSYSKTAHTGRFHNGSTVEFGYCKSEGDVYRYQSAEYDVIRFDELTHFTEHMYIYLLSRLRGANSYPKQMKSATNPGGIGHDWVKRRFVDIGPPYKEHLVDGGTRLFIPSSVEDNRFLTEKDKGYKNRLKRLNGKDRLALLEGEWNISDGRFFPEWRSGVHVVEPFVIPDYWTRYFTMDYGLDMLAGYCVALSENGTAYVYKEIYEPELIVSEAAARIRESVKERITAYFAPPDLWNRRNDTGRSAADIFAENGIFLTRAPASRVSGWIELKERIRVFSNERGEPDARLKVFSSCVNAIRCVPAITRSPLDPNDCALRPHGLTHACDALRYFAAAMPLGDGENEITGDYQLNNLLSYRI